VRQRVFALNVVAGLVAAILFSLLLRPVSIVAWQFLTSASGSIFLAIQEKAVQNAALGKRDWIAPLFLVLVAGMGVAALIVLIFLPVLRWLSRRRMSDKSRADRSRRRTFWFGYWLLAAGAVCMTLWFGLIAFFGYVDLQMNASFSQRVDAISPYTDDDTIKRLRSDWALMKRLDDYRGINSRIDAIAAKANLKIPSPLYE